MDKFEYLKLGLKNGWYKDAYWVKSLLSVFLTEDDTYYLVRRDSEGFYTYTEDKKIIRITGSKDTAKPLLRPGEMLDISVKEGIPGISSDIRTSVGCLIQNYALVIGPFKGKVPYINKPFSPGNVEKIFLPKWKRSLSEVTADKPEKPGEVFTEEYLEYVGNALHLTNYSQTVVPSVTRKALMKNPLVEKRRKELYEIHKDELDNPVVIAQISAELAKIDKEYLKDDESSGFMLGSKPFDNVRMRLNNHFGMARSLEDNNPGTFVDRPLSEGIDQNRLPEYVNDAYVGSIGRGLETQEGGVKVKNAIRSAANLKVESNDDCGTKIGQMVKMEDKETDNLKYLGYWFIENGKNIEITEENLAKISGKVLEMRSPSLCQNGGSSYCKRCAGPNLSAYPNGIASANANISSILMNLSMQMMHSAQISTVKWKIDLIS